MRFRVDQSRCQGHARCFALAPDLFDIDDEGRAKARVDAAPEQLAAALKLAVVNCPERAIEISRA